jgi:hypothetical protein
MRIASKRASAVWIPLLASAAFAAGCFKPKVQDNGFLCADAGATDAGTCPEGFHCAPTGLCKQDPREVCTSSKPLVDPIQSCAPDPGHDCDPLCQSRCECGRCTLVGNKVDCTPTGMKDRGQVCNFANDDCKPGNVCLQDCEKKVARCFRFCGGPNTPPARDDICPGQCFFRIEDVTGSFTGFTACDPPAVQCNPVGDTSNDCGDPALGCYVLSTGATACDCKGTIAAGSTGCGVYNSCVAGYSCVSLNGGVVATCLKTCRMGQNDCASGVCMQAALGNFGYCSS